MNGLDAGPPAVAPRVDGSGRVDLQSLEEMGPDGLRRWVVDRLAGRDLVVPGASCPGDMPHVLLATLYLRGGPTFRRDLEGVILGLLRDLVAEPEPWSGDEGRELLMLVDPVLIGEGRRDEAIRLLLDVAGDRRPAASSLRESALQGLVALRYCNRDFWESLTPSGDRGLAPIILGGLAEDGPAVVFDWLAGAGDDPVVRDALIGILPDLIEVYGPRAVEAEIARGASRLAPGLRAAVAQFYEDENWPSPIRAAMSEPGRRPEGPDPRPGHGVAAESPVRYGGGGRIYVGNLNYAVTSEDLRALFEPFGTVTFAEVQVKSRTGQSRGFGMVEMADGLDGAIAALHNFEHQGRPLTVNESRPRRIVRDQYAGGGWYG